MDTYPCVVLGAGSAAEPVFRTLRDRPLAVVEAERVGGTCPYLACMPSKALLRSASLRSGLRRAVELGAAGRAVDPGAAGPAWARATRRRDAIAEGRDDAEAAAQLLATGATLVRGRGVIEGPGRLRVGDRLLAWGALVIATGSTDVRPAIPGLDLVPTWSSDEALAADELPASLAILGGGPVGCELAQVYASFGSRVTLVEAESGLLPREEPLAGELVAEVLRADGAVVRLGTRVEAASLEAGRARLRCHDGTAIVVDRVLLGLGRRPRTDGIGLETLGLAPGGGGLAIDDRCRVIGPEHVYAAGDVTAVAPFTHTAAYQGRIVASALAGGSARADYRAIPRVVYTTPPVAAVGRTESQARAEGAEVVTAEAEVGATARAAADGDRLGRVKLVADREEGILLGACAVGGGADAFIGELALAIRARVPVALLAELVHPFPSQPEVLEPALRSLAAACT